MMKLFTIIFLAFAFQIAAQPAVNITGTVTDINGKTLSGASVRLIDLGLSTVTDSVGHFVLSLAEVNASVIKSHFCQPFISGDFLNFTVPNRDIRVKIDAFDCKGRIVHYVLNKVLPDGAYRIAPCRAKSSTQLYFLRLSIGTVCTYFKMPYFHDNVVNSATSASAGEDLKSLSLAKKTAAVDTLIISLSGYSTEKKPMDSYVGNYYIVLKKGSAGQISFDKLNYLCATKATITVVDSDLDVNVPYLQIAVSSTSDPAWIFLILSPVSGKQGTFSGVLNFSTKTSSQNTILVYDGDTITAMYSDANPPAYIKATAIWSGVVGKVSVDSVSYKGQSKMTITVDDADVPDSTVVVKVKSEKDTAGIMVTLKANAGKFTGKVGFSYGASTASSIAAADSDTVTVIYNDRVPKTTVTKTAVYYQGLIRALGIFSSLATPGTFYVPGLFPKLFIWSGTCTIDSVPNYMDNGNTVRITAGGSGWAGFGWSQSDNTGSTIMGIDMVQFAACSLHVRLKSNAAGIKLIVQNVVPTTGQTWVPASTYGYVGDEQWHEIVVPLSAWAATCDFSNVSYFMGVTFDPFMSGQYIIVDDLYWTLP